MRATNKRAMNKQTASSISKCPSQWFQPTQTKAISTIAKPGDILEFECRALSHWAVYICVKNSKPYVTDLNSPHYQKPLSDVAGTIRVRINNSIDVLYNPTEVDSTEIERRAKTFTEETPRGMLGDSCLHFAMYCRFGITLKPQPKLINQMVKTVNTGSVIAVCLASGLIGFWMGDCSSAALGLALGASLSFTIEVLPIAFKLLTTDGSLQHECFHGDRSSKQNSLLTPKSKPKRKYSNG